jgi:multidrug resistance efflux pump
VNSDPKNVSQKPVTGSEPLPASEQETAQESTQDTGTRDPVRRWTRIILAVCVFLFVWYVLADRYAPWTDQARVQGFVIPMAPKVSGRVLAVNVVQDQIVKEGDLLLQIDPRDFELAVQKAEAALERAGQDIGAGTDAVAAAQAKLTEARTELEYTRVQAKRYLALAKKGTISKADADKANAAVKKAGARVANAQAALDKAKEELGREGEENPRIRDAIAALEKARRDLESTSLRAPMDGGITNLRVQEGYYANAGQPLMTFASAKDVWVQANLRENSIGNLKAGDPADIALDVAPGRIFPGRVASIGFAVNQPTAGAIGEAVTVQGDSGWLRDAQRFPVIIDFADESAFGLRRAGGQADVQVYTQGSNWLLNSLGWLWIRLMSLLSYVY